MHVNDFIVSDAGRRKETGVRAIKKKYVSLNISVLSCYDVTSSV